MIRCGINVSEIEDKEIGDVFSRTIGFFRKEGKLLKHKIIFQGNGFISIEGIGKDSRCAFCEYLRKALSQRVEKGAISLTKCPFNPDKRIDNSSETKAARKKLLDRFVKEQGPVVVEKVDG